MKVVKQTNLKEGEDVLMQIRSLDNDMGRLFQLVTGRIEFGAGSDGFRGVNMAGRFQTFTTSATPDAENTVAHGLGAVPSGLYIVMSQNLAGSLYLGSTSWTATNAYFKCDVASVTFKVFILP